MSHGTSNPIGHWSICCEAEDYKCEVFPLFILRKSKRKKFAIICVCNCDKMIQVTDDNKTIMKLSKSDTQLTVSIGQFYQKIKQN